MPKISVIIPCYNQGQYLDEAVASVQAQTFANYEIIIVNDGSTDPDTVEILAGYERPRTRVIHTENQGLAAARNNGIREARGRYILPLDADDRIGAAYLERAVAVLDENPGIGIVYCRAWLFGEMDSEWVLPEFSLEEMLLDNIIFCSSFFRRRDWEEVGGYDPEMKHGWEDYDFWLSLIERGRLVHRIPEILFHYRVTADSMVRSKQKSQKVETFARIYRKHQPLFSENIDIWLDRIVESGEEYRITRLYLDTGDGFNEAQALTQKLDTRTRSLTFELSSFAGVERLRFDPVDDYCVLHLNSVVLTSAAGEGVELESSHGNVIESRQSGNLVFTDNDPHLVFDIPVSRFRGKGYGHLAVSLEYLAVGKSAFFYILRRKDEEIARSHAAIRHFEEEMVHLRSMTWQDMGSLVLKKAKLAAKRLKYRFNREYRAINNSGLFDAGYYFRQNKDLNSVLVDPVIHYFEHGHREGRDPHPLFGTNWYCDAYPEVAAGGVNPFAHFLRWGWKEGKNPCPMFETSYYLKTYPEVAEAGINPLRHYLETGAAEGKKPNPLFDSAYYLEHNPDVLEAGLNPLVHYVATGAREGRLTHEPGDSFRFSPLISIVTPVYNVEEKYLRACIDSVVNQAYENWEICLVDDGSSKPHVRRVLEEYAGSDHRIRVRFLPENQGISGATNEAAGMARGEYIGFLDNDDELTRDALLEVVRRLNLEEADIVYSDECFIDAGGGFVDAHHKPDFSADMLMCHNYITHFLVMRRELFDRVGGLSTECDGAQDYDLVLKAAEQTDRIAHIPRILYRWRTLETSTSSDPAAKSYADSAGRKALQDALARKKIEAEVLPGNLPFYYRVRRRIEGTPLVSVIIPFCDQPDYLRRCIESIRERTAYGNFEVIGISNNSRDDRTRELMRKIAAEDSRFTFTEYNRPFNFSAINNHGVEMARGDHVVFMNNDIEVLNGDWLEALLEHSQRPEVGAVGAKLYYGDDRVQHAGIILGIGGFAGHSHRFMAKDSPGYFNRLNCTQNVSAVTAALLMVKKSLFEEAGGFDEEKFGVALNDVDFCLKLREKGYVNIFTPYCEARHYESVSRGYEDTPEKKERFLRELSSFKEKWSNILNAGDPYYNRNLTLIGEDFARNRYLAWYDSEAQRREYLDNA
jgi:glycosyltransferase involved in cell wall biosynthesis